MLIYTEIKPNQTKHSTQSLIPQSHLLYGGRTLAVELQNRVIPAVAVEILRWPQGHRTANPYVRQALKGIGSY